MNIKQFSELTGISAYTLRYYEKIGLLKHISRNRSGHRVYTQKDADWLGFIIRLKATAMPLEDILTYASLRDAGTDTLEERQQLLKVHRERLKAHIDAQQLHLTALDHKIQLYRDKQVS